MYDNVSGEFHPQGLYSNEIFGRPGTPERSERHGFMNLRTTLFHPKLYIELTRLKSLYGDILSGRGFAVWDKKLRDFVKSDVINGETGYAFFMEHFTEIKFVRNKSHQRDLRVDLIEKFRADALSDYWIILPAGLRDVQLDEEGRPIEVDVNKSYRKLLMLANTISEAFVGKSIPILDRTRHSMQMTLQDIWEYFMLLFSGKNGFMEAKFGSRKIANGTTNVISSMDVAPESLDGPSAKDASASTVGLFQYMKMTDVIMTEYAMVKGIASSLIETVNATSKLINPKTLKLESHDTTEVTRVNWGTLTGRQGLVNRFNDSRHRHRPVWIDGKYLALIYRDNRFFKVLYDIDDLPEYMDRSKVSPLTWAEYFYIEAWSYNDRVRGFLNRYPITGSDSIYPSTIYVNTTVVTNRLRALDESWVPEYGEDSELPEFPDTAGASAFIDTSSPHPLKLSGLGADFDGDRGSTTGVASDESIAEIDEHLNSPATYLAPDGTLRMSSGTDLNVWIFNNFTGYQ